MLNNKSQIAQTTNWVVATIIIIVILIISLLLANGSWFEKSIEFQDKQKDLVATKTIVNYINSDFENIQEFISEENYSKLDTNLKPLLEKLWYQSRGSAWNLYLYVDDSLTPTYPITIYTLGDKESYLLNILFNVGEKKIKMRFWEETGYIPG